MLFVNVLKLIPFNYFQSEVNCHTNYRLSAEAIYQFNFNKNHRMLNSMIFILNKIKFTGIVHISAEE